MAGFYAVKMSRHIALAIAGIGLLTACHARVEGEQAEQLPNSICEPLMFEQARFTVCTARPTTHVINLDLATEGEVQPYRSLPALSQALGEDAGQVVMAMNAGMFDANGQPLGYYVEQGRRLVVVNERKDEGNFYLLPNGVFYGEEEGPWHIRETTTFVAATADRPHFATQSGPMLVIDGRLHPSIAADGASLHIRNAVGVDASGRALFVISEDAVSLGKLARLYRDILNVENALYLDGAISALWDPGNGRMDETAPLGPLILVENRAEAGS